MKGTLILVAAAFGAGLGIGFLLSELDAAAPRAGNPRPMDAPDVREKSVGSSDDDSSAWVRSVPAPRVEGGDGTITGTVTANGKPLAGVVVRATRQFPYVSARRWRRGDPVPETQSVEKRARQYVASLKRTDLARREATTGADGGYVVEGLADAAYFLGAYREGYAVEVKDQRNRNSRPGATVHFEALPVVDVPLEIVMPPGIEMSDLLSVQAGRIDQGPYRHVGWQRGETSMRFIPGRYRIHAQQGDECKSDPVEVDVALDHTEPIVLTLKARLGIRGEVVCDGGVILGQRQVRLLPFKAGNPPRDEQLVELGQREWLHGGTPSFHFRDLQPGTYALGLTVGQKQLVARTTVEIVDRPVDVELKAKLFDPADCVRITVLGPDEKKIDDVQFNTSFRSDRSSSSGGNAVIRLDDGTYLVHHHDPQGIGKSAGDPGTYGVAVTSKKYGKRQLYYQLGDRREFTIRYRAPARLVVEVTGYAESNLVGGLSLQLKAAASKEQVHGHFSRGGLGVDARQRFGPLEPGDYILHLFTRVTEHGTLPAGEIRLTLQSGDNERSVPLPAVQEVVILAPTLKKGANIQLNPIRNKGQTYYRTRVSIGDDRKAVFSRVPAGDYKVQCWDGQQFTMEIRVPGPKVVRFEPVDQNAYLVTITDAAGDFAKAGLRTGDLIVGADGKEFENSRHAQALLMGAMAKEKAKLLIQRQHTRFEVEIEGKKMMEGGSKAMGAKLEPAAR